MLDEARAQPVVWLTGSPGAGKTTLVSTWVAARNLRHLWYSLDAGDADPASWFLHLREGAMAIDARHRRLPLFTADYLPASDMFARRFFRELYRRLPADWLLIFDDYHQVPASAPFHELFAIACEAVPEQLSLIVMSREDPPPPLEPLRARERLTVVDGAALDLTADEARTIARSRTRDDAAAIEDLHRASRGWAAGFTLMLDVPKGRLVTEQDRFSREAVFRYFAGTVLDRIAPADRAALLQLALLPRFTPDMARRMANRPSLQGILESMRRRRLFVYASGPWREFHALFREFLLARMREDLSRERCRRALSRAAAVLEKEGLHDDSLALRIEAGQWRDAEDVLLRNAERMLAEGRWRSVLAFLDRMPSACVEASAGLRYWRGLGRQHINPLEAREDLRLAAQALAQAGDPVGEALALAALSQIDLAMDHRQSDWADAAARLDRAVASVRVWPSSHQEATVLAAWMFTMQHLNPSHPAIRRIALRVADLAETGENTGARAHCAVQALLFLVTVGDFDRTRRLMGILGRTANAPTTSVPDRVLILTYLALAQYGLFLRFDEALHSIEQARRLAFDHGLHWAELPLLQFEVEIHVYTNRDPAAGRAALERMKNCGLSAPSVGAVFYHCTAAQADLWDGSPARALRHAKQGLQAAQRMSPGFHVLFGRWLVHVYSDAGDFSGAASLLADVETHLKGTCFEKSSAAVVVMQRAYLALAQGDRPRSHSLLRQAFSIMSTGPGSEAPVYWMGRALAVLLAEALDHDIESAMARDLIRRLDLPPAGRASGNWPWPVAVRTLGGFELRRHGVVVSFGRKVPRKTLALLKALIAFGGRDVREERLIDALWPEEEGDAAHGAYTMTVVRLRRLLGDPKSLVQRGRTLSLDPRRCHVDLLADGVASVAAAERGEFLPDDDDAAWAEPVRWRLRRTVQGRDPAR